jgi:hypothetical protein
VSRTVGMVPVFARKPRPMHVARPSCTACGAPLLDAIAVIGGKLRTDALACSACGRLGVQCQCRRRVA